MATRRWADDVLEAAWAVIVKAGRLVDDVDYLHPQLEEKTEMPSEQVERIQVDEQIDKENQMSESAGQDDQDDML